MGAECSATPRLRSSRGVIEMRKHPPVVKVGPIGKEIPMESLALAIKLADLAAEAEERGEPVDVSTEAKRLVREHPEAEFDVKEVAEVLEEEQAAVRVEREG